MNNYIKILEELNRNGRVTTTLHGEIVSLQLHNDGISLSLSTSLFCDSYIPHSVREFLHRDPIQSMIDTQGLPLEIRVNEEECRVILNGRGDSEILRPTAFCYFLESYLQVADELRALLNEEGSRDYVYAYHIR